MNEYYVYEWIRLDTNEPFYVGKGKSNRWKKLNREYNPHFTRIINKCPIAVNILHDNLDEQMAFDLEVWYIWQYRDVIGYDLCNINDGGEGQSLCGELNPMYGKPCSDERKKNISESRKGMFIGEDNPFYGKHHTNEARDKISKANKGKLSGKNNPNYGKQFSKETRKKMSESQSGKNHSRITPVICITTKKIFLYAKEGATFYNVDRSSIIKCCKGKLMSAGKYKGKPLKWKYVNWNHNKKFRISK